MSKQETRKQVAMRATEVLDALVTAHVSVDRTTAIAMVLLGLKALHVDGLDEQQLGMACGAFVRITVTHEPS